MSLAQPIVFNGNAAVANTTAITVSAGTGIVVFALYGSGIVTAPTLTDTASGQTWSQSGPILALPNNNESMCAFTPNQSVLSGVHQFTFGSGLGNIAAFVYNDTNPSPRAAAIGQVLETPGSGQTLTPGGTVGNSGDTVYMVAMDASSAATASQPVVGTGGFTSDNTNNDAAFGSWLAGHLDPGTGGIPSFAPGTAGAAEETGVLAIAFAAGGGGGVNTAPIYWVV